MAWLSERRWGLSAAALVAVLAVGCGGGQAQNAQTYVGRVTTAGADTVIGAVSDGVDVSFYVCGGPTSFATSRWILGSAGSNGAIDLSSNGSHVTGNLQSGSGTIAADGQTALSWTVRLASGTLEGLYQSFDGQCRTGAVVGDFGDGRGLRMQGTWCDAASHFAQVTPIKNPLTLDPQGIEVSVDPPGPANLVLARLVTPLPLP
jgi:hypothetical protein